MKLIKNAAGKTIVKLSHQEWLNIGKKAGWFQLKTAETAALGIDDSKKSTDVIMLRQAIIAELDATNLYEQMSQSSNNEEFKKLMLDIRDEELQHVGEFEQLLEKLDPEHKKSIEKGKKEGEELNENN
jgi:rubrerythrin